MRSPTCRCTGWRTWVSSVGARPARSSPRATRGPAGACRSTPMAAACSTRTPACTACLRSWSRCASCAARLSARSGMCAPAWSRAWAACSPPQPHWCCPTRAIEAATRGGARKMLGFCGVVAAEKAAVMNGTTGASLSYRELEERSNRFAQYLYALGLRRGERIAMLLENHLRCFEVAWAAFRSGLLLTAVNRYLTADEAAYIITDSDARVVVSSFAMRALAAQLSCAIPACERRLMLDGTVPGWASYEQAIAAPSPAGRA